MAKNCKPCNRQLPESAFNKNANSSDGLCVICRQCSAQRNREWRKKNPHGFSDWAKANKAQLKENWAEWSAKNKERLSENYARWVEENRAHVYARNAARVAAKLRATPPWADAEKIKEVYAQAVALSKQTGLRYEVDHFYPLRGRLVSGLHCHENLQILSRSENARKKNHMPLEMQ